VVVYAQQVIHNIMSCSGVGVTCHTTGVTRKFNILVRFIYIT